MPPFKKGRKERKIPHKEGLMGKCHGLMLFRVNLKGKRLGYSSQQSEKVENILLKNSPSINAFHILVIKFAQF